MLFISTIIHIVNADKIKMSQFIDLVPASNSAANYSFKTNHIIERSILEFNGRPMPINIFDDTPDQIFGILTLKIQKTSINKQPIYILFTVDKTFSMDSHADKLIKKDSKTKMYYLINTFKNMIEYLSKLHDTEIYIHVQSFNLTVEITVDDVKVTESNAAEIIEKINNLEVSGLTNIEIALKQAANTLATYHSANPTHKIAHIFMTDGEPTFGERDDSKLAAIVNDKFINIFIGFGETHNAELMQKFSEKKNVEYYFVDNVKNTGYVYGQIMHRLLYPAIENIRLDVRNGFIYDWKANAWVESLEEDVLLSDMERIYHIKSNMPDEVDVKIYGDLPAISVAAYYDSDDDDDASVGSHISGTSSSSGCDGVSYSDLD